MAKAYYLPRTDRERGVWITTFANKIALFAALLGLTAVDVTNVGNDAAFYNWVLSMLDIFTTGKEERTSFKNLMAKGPLGTPIGTIPLAPVLPAAPVTVAPGIFIRIARLVQRIKGHPNYTEAIGESLGIIAPEDVKDLTTIQPTLKLSIKGSSNVEVKWNKGDADSIYIEKDKGQGWQFLTSYTRPRYEDTTPITTPAVWKYRAIYIIDNERVGNWSAVASIVVGAE